jgi:hypothetical protein
VRVGLPQMQNPEVTRERRMATVDTPGQCFLGHQTWTGRWGLKQTGSVGNGIYNLYPSASKMGVGNARK